MRNKNIKFRPCKKCGDTSIRSICKDCRDLEEEIEDHMMDTEEEIVFFRDRKRKCAKNSDYEPFFGFIF